MILEGTALAQPIINQLRTDIEILKQHNITPKIAIITVGGEETWKSYVGQKLKLAKNLGIETKLIHLEQTNEKNLFSNIEQCNNDNNIHGIIVQRPLPNSIDRTKITNAISPSKDIDGFRDDSKFKSPIWLTILEFLHYSYNFQNNLSSLPLREKDTLIEQKDWMKTKTFAVIGKGETGGGPTISELIKLDIAPSIIDSQTTPEQKIKLLQIADIIISATGKSRVVTAKDLKPGAILIGIGIHRGEDGKLHGDYEENEIKNAAGFYTPTPGGVGPLNLAFLFKNLIKSASN